MWKFKNFSATSILREINFGKFQAAKIAISDNFRGPEFGFWQICAISKAQIYQNSNSRVLKTVKMVISYIQILPKMISRKIEWQKNS